MQVTSIVETSNYAERVYAGVLGKIIGVYLGRPFEQWSHERIERELGEITGYVHEQLGMPLIVADDDISGTFSFLRALPEHGNDPNLTAAQIGDWWRNLIIEGRTILWWGGIGLSTEHTAFLRLKAGVKAPDSGSIAMNGAAVAEEIGAQIFIDGWGLISPGDPARAIDWARRAASVSHDGEAIYGAQVVAALVAMAFVRNDLPAMINDAAAFVPYDSLIFQVIEDMQRWADQNGDDWRATLAKIHERYPYSRFGTNCPMVSNHAIVLLALLHGQGDFSRSLMIANTAGYDTDCNSGNVGCILGVMNGLAGLATGPDWRGPVADRLFVSTADGGRTITDAVRETDEIVNIARALRHLPPLAPKNGARFHFSLPGSVQGWRGEGMTVTHDNSQLLLRSHGGTPGGAGTPTWTPPDAFAANGYNLAASPTLYPGQKITASVQALDAPVRVRLHVKTYGADGAPVLHYGPAESLAPGQDAELSLTVPDTDGAPVYEVGLDAASDAPAAVLLDWLTWGGTPSVVFKKPGMADDRWHRAWVSGVDEFGTGWVSAGQTYRMIQNTGMGMATQGTAEWRNYAVRVDVLPHLAERIGLVAAFRGLRRYVALILDMDRRVRLIRQHDDVRTVLAESDATWAYEKMRSLSLTITDSGVTASVGDHILTANGDDLPQAGAVGLMVEAGHAEFGPVTVSPA